MIKERNTHFLVYLFPLILFALVYLLFSFDGLYGQDAYEYLRFTNRLKIFFITGNDPGYFFWPYIYPLVGGLLSLVIGSTILSLQLISVLSFSLTGFFILKIFNLIYKQLKSFRNIYLILFFYLSPIMVRSSLLTMADMLSVLFSTAAIYYVIRYKKYLFKVDFLLSIVFICLSVLTRYNSFVLLIFPTLFLLYTFLKNFNLRLFFITLLLVASFILPHAYIHRGSELSFLSHPWLIDWSIKNFILNIFATVDGFQHYRLLNIFYSLSIIYYPVFLFVGLIFVFYLKKKDIFDDVKLLLFLSLLIYLIFIAGIPFQNLRFLEPAFPIVIILFFPAFRRFLYSIKKWKIYIPYLMVIVIIIQFLITYKYGEATIKLNKFEREVASELIKTNKGKTVYTFSLNEALKARGVRNKIVNLFYKKLKNVDESSLILFNESKFLKQWEGRNPMINWKFIKSNYKLNSLKKYSNNWELFEIE